MKIKWLLLICLPLIIGFSACATLKVDNVSQNNSCLPAKCGYRLIYSGELQRIAGFGNLGNKSLIHFNDKIIEATGLELINSKYEFSYSYLQQKYYLYAVCGICSWKSISYLLSPVILNDIQGTTIKTFEEWENNTIIHKGVLQYIDFGTNGFTGLGSGICGNVCFDDGYCYLISGTLDTNGDLGIGEYYYLYKLNTDHMVGNEYFIISNVELPSNILRNLKH
jgi:hypothetical protein